MTEVTKPEKAELRELDADFKNEINEDKNTKVQFNPETLKVSFANQIVKPEGKGDKTGSPAQQFVGAGTTKLSLQIWFDITVLQSDELPVVDDVRKLTQKVAYFITPRPESEGSNTFIPPSVRFIWGSFQFDGLMDSLEESLDFFRNKEGSYQAQQSRRRFWLVLVADSHANPQVMQSHGDHGQGITHSGPRIAQNISDTAVSLEPSIAVFNADPS